jgi:hypothetical protein
MEKRKIISGKRLSLGSFRLNKIIKSLPSSDSQTNIESNISILRQDNQRYPLKLNNSDEKSKKILPKFDQMPINCNFKATTLFQDTYLG